MLDGNYLALLEPLGDHGERFFTWEFMGGRILTINQLRKRGWKMPNACYMCKWKKN